MKRLSIGLVVMVAITAPSPMLHAAAQPTTAPAVDAQPIPFERETLPNGLRVIYAPMTNAPGCRSATAAALASARARARSAGGAAGIWASSTPGPLWSR